MAMAQVTDNPAMADGSSIHHDVSQRIHDYIHIYILPLHRAGKVFNEKAILYRIKTRLNHDFDIIGKMLFGPLSKKFLVMIARFPNA